eukprot:scaffold25254_cov20-Tisochrysis_lutea.AAC.1
MALLKGSLRRAQFACLSGRQSSVNALWRAVGFFPSLIAFQDLHSSHLMQGRKLPTGEERIKQGRLHPDELFAGLAHMNFFS